MPCAAFSADRLQCSRTRWSDDCLPTTSVVSDRSSPTIIVRIRRPRDFAKNNIWGLGVGFSPLPTRVTGVPLGLDYGLPLGRWW